MRGIVAGQSFNPTRAELEKGVHNEEVRSGSFRIILIPAMLAALCGALSAQSTKTADLALGKVLVMEQKSPDPNFAESVILLIHYDKDGVVGLMLNQPSDVPLSQLKDVKGTGKRSDPVYVGGPVELEMVTVLVRATKAPPDGLRVSGDLYAVQTRRGIEAAIKGSKGPNDLRVYLGYSGWDIPQIENEVKLGSWFIFDHGERYVFDSAPHTLWKRLIDRTGAQFAFAPEVIRSRR